MPQGDRIVTWQFPRLAFAVGLQRLEADQGGVGPPLLTCRVYSERVEDNMPFETLIIVGAILAVFAVFMAVLAGTERYSNAGRDTVEPAE